MATPRLAGDVAKDVLRGAEFNSAVLNGELRDKSDGALLLAFVLRTYGEERARGVVQACLGFIEERERELREAPEPERDTLPATLFWCECSAPTPDREHSELCTWCKRLLRPLKEVPPFCSNCGAEHPNERHVCPRDAGQD